MPIRLVVEFLSLAFFYFLLFPSLAWAALTINDVSPTTINSADDVITVSATASGLSSSTQYLQMALTRETGVTNYLGLTKNLSGEWYLYKSSPTSTDLSSYFYSFTPIGSTWSGQIQTKIDINDDGFLGPGNYILKLIKYISSSGSLSNNTFTITVNVASPSSQTATSQDTTSALSPDITVDIGNSFVLGEAFNISLKLKNFDANQDYYLKFRAGTDENTLNKGQTKNGSVYLSDTESWSRFPSITTDGSGKWEGQVSARISEDKTPEQYITRIRARKRDSDTFSDSGTKTISLSVPPETTETINQTSSITNKIITPGTSSANSINLVLGTASAATVTPTASDIAPKNKKDQSPNNSGIFSVIMIFIGLGTLLCSLVLLSVKFRIWERWLTKKAL